MLTHEEQTRDHNQWIAKVCEHLNKLIQIDVDAACSYREAIAHVGDASVKYDLESFLFDHERHVMELTSVIRDLGGSPIHAHRDFKGAVLEGMTKLRSRGTLGALRAMRMNERLTNRTYDRALDRYMPPIGQAIVIENLKDERRHLAAIEEHIARLTGTPVPDLVPTDREDSDREDRFPIM
jgi:rubrerythrin